MPRTEPNDLLMVCLIDGEEVRTPPRNPHPRRVRYGSLFEGTHTRTYLHIPIPVALVGFKQYSLRQAHDEKLQ
jgi:hypothetical protein